MPKDSEENLEALRRFVDDVDPASTRLPSRATRRSSKGEFDETQKRCQIALFLFMSQLWRRRRVTHARTQLTHSSRSS
jgi:hypothetical protein